MCFSLTTIKDVLTFFKTVCGCDIRDYKKRTFIPNRYDKFYDKIIKTLQKMAHDRNVSLEHLLSTPDAVLTAAARREMLTQEKIALDNYQEWYFLAFQ